MKQISTAAVRSSFVIWLSQDSRTSDKSFFCEDTLSSLQSENTAIGDFKAARRKTVPPCLYGGTKKSIFAQIKSNTCYASSIVQALNALSEFSSVLLSTSSENVLVQTLSKLLFRLNSSDSPVDPAAFLSALEKVVIESGNSGFRVSTQQDAPEILFNLLNVWASAFPRLCTLF